MVFHLSPNFFPVFQYWSFWFGVETRLLNMISYHVFINSRESWKASWMGKATVYKRFWGCLWQKWICYICMLSQIPHVFAEMEEKLVSYLDTPLRVHGFLLVLINLYNLKLTLSLVNFDIIAIINYLSWTELYVPESISSVIYIFFYK